MNSKTFSFIGYSLIFILAVLFRMICGVYDFIETPIVDILLLAGGIYIYRKQKSNYSPQLIIHLVIGVVCIYLIWRWIGFFANMFLYDYNKIFAGFISIIIEYVTSICIILFFIRLCENIKFRKIKKYIMIAVVASFFMCVVHLMRFYIINGVIVYNSMVEFEQKSAMVKQVALIVKDFMKCIIMVGISNGLLKIRRVDK